MAESPSCHSRLGSQPWSCALESCWLVAGSLGGWGPLGEGWEGRGCISECSCLHASIQMSIFSQSLCSAECLSCFSPSWPHTPSAVHPHLPNSLGPSSHSYHFSLHSFYFIHRNGFLGEDISSADFFLSLFLLEGPSGIFLGLGLSILSILNDFFLIIFLKKLTSISTFEESFCPRWLRKYSFYTVSLLAPFSSFVKWKM